MLRHMLSRAEAVKLARDVVDYQTKSHVGAARELSQFLIAEESDREKGKADNYRQLADALTACQARGTELIGHRRTLCRIIRALDAAVKSNDFNGVKRLVDEGMTACAAMQ